MLTIPVGEIVATGFAKDRKASLATGTPDRSTQQATVKPAVDVNVC
jgi:hypothetical protein